MISFAPMADALKRAGRSKTWLKTSGAIGGSTWDLVSRAMIAPISEGVSISAIDRICAALDCQPADIIEYVPTPNRP